jgi:hypothetical protein
MFEQPSPKRTQVALPILDPPMDPFGASFSVDQVLLDRIPMS